MKNLKYLILVIFLSIMIFPVYAEEISLNSQNAVLYNLNDNRILYEKEKEEKVSIASLTKLMTALVAVNNIKNLNEEVSFDKSDYDKLIKQDATSSSLKKDEKHTYEELLYGLILESGADCSNALTRLTFGTEEEFVKEMNKTAKKIGMKNTSFSNPIGLDDKNNYSSMEDMGILLKEDLKNENLNKIINTMTYKLSDGKEIHHTIYGYMKKFNIDIPYMNGGKTGYEINSGYALASTATNDDVTLMLITTKAKEKGDHIRDAKEIYDYYFNNYDYVKIISKGDTLVTLKGKFLSKDKINITADNTVTYYMNKNYKKDDLKYIYEGQKTLSLKDKYAKKLGTLKVYYKNDLIKEYPVKLNQKLYPDFKLIGVAIITYIFIIGTTKVVIKRIHKKQ